MKIIGAMLVRNESGRYLAQVLCKMRRICDKIVVVDDCSEDNTAQICQCYGCKVYQGNESLWGTNELFRRKQLWDLATKEADDGDWILVLDADEIIDGIDLLKGSISQATTQNADCVAFNLYDMWDESHYREDLCWDAHTKLSIICIKYHASKEYIWPELTLHCGRFPANSYSVVLPTGARILHYGWAKPEDRQSKYARYMKIDPEGKMGNLAQYQSILDEHPNLIEMRFHDGENTYCQSCKG